MALSDFIARIKTVGLPNASHFMVDFLGTSGFTGGRDVSMMVEEASLPGLNIMTADMRVFGEIIESPYGISYQPVQLTVIVDNESAAKKFFDEWTNSVFDRNRKVIGYYNDFVKDVRITLLDKNSNPIYVVLLRDAFPKSMADIPLSYSNREVVKLQVQLGYKFWQEEPIDFEESRESRENIINPEQKRFNERFSKATLSSDSFGKSSGEVNNFDWGNPNDVGNMLAKFGPASTISSSTAFGRAINALDQSTVPNANNIKTSLSNLSSNFVQMNSGMVSLGNNLVTVSAPLVTLSNSTSSISTNLTSLNTSLSTGGFSARYGSVASNFALNSSSMSGVSTLPKVPREIQTLGANVTALGIEFQKSSKDLKAHVNVSVAFNKLGNSLRTQGNNLYNGGANLQTYSDNHP